MPEMKQENDAPTKEATFHGLSRVCRLGGSVLLLPVQIALHLIVEKAEMKSIYQQVRRAGWTDPDHPIELELVRR